LLLYLGHLDPRPRFFPCFDRLGSARGIQDLRAIERTVRKSLLKLLQDDDHLRAYFTPALHHFVFHKPDVLAKPTPRLFESLAFVYAQSCIQSVGSFLLRPDILSQSAVNLLHPLIDLAPLIAETHEQSQKLHEVASNPVAEAIETSTRVEQGNAEIDKPETKMEEAVIEPALPWKEWKDKQGAR
jgi:hypothetical protein